MHAQRMHARGVKSIFKACACDSIACVQVIVTIRADVNDMDVSKEQGDLSFTCNLSSVLFSSLTCFYETPRLALGLAQHEQTTV